MESCDAIRSAIKKFGYKVWRDEEDKNKCTIDFKHPKVKVEKPVSYFLSSVYYNKDNGFLEATIRSKVDDFKEVYGEYCCEDNEMKCRPHVNMDEKIFSIEAKFRKNQIEKFERLLEEMY